MKVDKIFFSKNPMQTPGMTNNIGSHTGPNSFPKSLSSGDNINPTVTKYAEKTNGRDANRGNFTPHSLHASHIAKK